MGLKKSALVVFVIACYMRFHLVPGIASILQLPDLITSSPKLSVEHLVPHSVAIATIIAFHLENQNVNVMAFCAPRPSKFLNRRKCADCFYLRDVFT